MKQLVLAPDAPAVQYGAGLFETILVVRGLPLLLGAHLDRLTAAIRELELPPVSLSEMVEAIEPALVSIGAAPEAVLRIAYLAIDRDLDERASWRLVTSYGPVAPEILARRRYGRVVLLDPSFRRGLAHLKTTSYFPAVIALRKARAAGADEGLFTDARGRILEGTTTNVFAIDGEALITPPAGSGLLNGVTRQWTIDCARRLGIRIRERSLSGDDLLGGSFLTGSLTRLVPIRRVDGEKSNPPGKIFDLIRRIFDREVVEGESGELPDSASD
ncbi:MAG: aminotransferase class IV [Thermoanaerobaculia bacterium]